MAESLATNPNWENLVAAISMLIVAAVGLIVYSLFMIAALSKKELRTGSFYMLATALGTADCTMLCLFTFYSVPKTLGLYMGGDAVNVVMGVMCNLSWFTSLILIAETSINRYICICKHNLNNLMFSPKRTKIMIAAAWGFGCACSFPSFNQCCYFLYFPNDYDWGYNVPALGSNIISYFDVTTDFIIGAVALICNTKCFLKIRQLHAQISASLPDHEVQRRKLEAKLFVQFFIISAFYMTEVVLFNVVFRFLDGKWLGLMVSIVYIGQCSINGYVYVLLNKAIRDQIGVLFGKHTKVLMTQEAFVVNADEVKISERQMKEIEMSKNKIATTDVQPNVVGEMY